MDGSSGYQQQSETALEKDVARGKISVTDYHQQKGRIRQITATGMDDGISRTQGMIITPRGLNLRKAIKAMASGALWLGLDAFYFKAFFGIYVVASGAPVHWPWNECPSKFVIRALIRFLYILSN